MTGNTKSLRGRSLLTLSDLTQEELATLLDLAARLKERRAQARRDGLLAYRTIALLFEKSSTRTRCALVTAAAEEGATAEYLGLHDIHLGSKESLPDTARVLGRMFDGIAFRGYRHDTVVQLARYAGIPVWNALTDDWHPTQALADLQTIREKFGTLRGLRITYCGDGRNNVVKSLILGAAKCGMHLIDCTPPELAPDPQWIDEINRCAQAAGGSIRVMHDPVAAVDGANILYTDVWASMGEERQFQERLQMLRPYQVTMALASATGNLENGRLIFLHCLPAFHNHDTDVTREIGPLEVTDEVFESTFSRVFDQAENRVHTIKALMVASLGNEEVV